MKKNLLSLLFISIIAISSRAQYVAIPDSNFGNWLNTNGYSSCLRGSSAAGWQLDTTCSNVMNDTTVVCSGFTIIDLTGIQYFSNLKTLSCYSNRLTTLPNLPTGLTSLYCDYNRLTSLPSLPAGLTYLICSDNMLTSLPTLPTGLLHFDCSNNMLTDLPGLPISLIDFYCNNNRLDSIPALPSNLEFFGCSSNLLVKLPSLPNSLSELYCDNNYILDLPYLPPSLVWLFCDHNRLTYIPNFPLGINRIICNYNLNLSCLPQIPAFQYVELHIDSTNIHCLPNRFIPNNCDINPDSLPLCNPASGCDFYYSIAGNIHSDTATTCTSDSLYPSSNLHNIKVQLSENGQVQQQFYTFTSGEYSFETDSLTSYDISIDTTNLPLMVACPNNGVRTVVLSPTDSVEINENFGVQCRGIDNGVSSIYSHFRSARQSVVNINVGDMAQAYGLSCANHSTGTITTTISGSSHYVSPATGAMIPTVSGSSLVYTISDFDSISPGDFDIVVQTDTYAVVGSSVCVTTTVLTAGGVDVNPANDSLTQCFTIQNSNDPNLKTVYPLTTVDTGAQWLTYTVNFQNTGNDTAYTVVVKDTLSQYVDASSFQYLASSHKAVIQLFGSAMTFTFPKINLVDSLHNEPLSHGWIQYKVKIKPHLPLTTQIKNTAFIYFDFNPAVVTNTTVNTVAVDTARTHVGLATVAAPHLHLYPNPATSSFTLAVDAEMIGTPYAFSDMTGRVIYSHVVDREKTVISLGGLSSGIYILQIDGHSYKVVKE